MGFLSRFKKDTSEPETREVVALPEPKEEVKQPKSKGGLRMKHEVEIKVPKFLNPLFENLTPEEKKKFGRVAMMCGTAALGLSVVYLTGYNRGMKKAITNKGIYIIKGGD